MSDTKSSLGFSFGSSKLLGKKPFLTLVGVWGCCLLGTVKAYTQAYELPYHPNRVSGVDFRLGLTEI